MPHQRRKSVRTIIAEAVMFIGAVAIAGHLAVNVWERFTVQSEIRHMKTSLHVLKNTVNTIGTAYDNLYKELQVLATVTRQNDAIYQPPKERDLPQKRSIYNMYKPQDIEVQAVIKPKIYSNVGTTFDGTIKDYKLPPPGVKINMYKPQDKVVQAVMKPKNYANVGTKFDETIKDFVKDYKLSPTPGVNVSTITRYPLKSTGTPNDKDCSKIANPSKKLSCCIHRCYRLL